MSEKKRINNLLNLIRGIAVEVDKGPGINKEEYYKKMEMDLLYIKLEIDDMIDDQTKGNNKKDGTI